MTHFGKCLCHCSLERGLLEDFNAQREGGSWKGAPESPLGGDDCLVERRQLKCLDVNRVGHLADYDPGILGVYVKRNYATFGRVRESETSRKNRGIYTYLSSTDLSEHF